MVTYRRLNSSDVLKMLRTWKESGLHIREKGRESPKALRSEMRTNSWGFIGAWDRGELVGLVIATSDGRKGWINRLAVLPSHRGKGIGPRLIQLAEKEIRARGIGIVSALIERENKTSVKLFVKAGYELSDDIAYLRKEFVKGS